MKESIWGYAVIVFGIIAIVIVWFFTDVTNTDQHNYNLLKESVEAAMYDSVDLAAYRKDGTIKIIKEKFLENFIRRFSENASLANTYKIDIYDINEEPPKVSLKVSSIKSTKINDRNGDTIDISFDIVNHIDAILENKFISECTEKRPCYYWQDYVSWPKIVETSNSKFQVTAELKIPGPLSTYNVSISDVKFLGSASSPADIKMWYDKRSDLLLDNGREAGSVEKPDDYENYVNDIVDNLATINSGSVINYGVTSSAAVKEYYKINFKFDYICKVNDTLNDLDGDKEKDSTKNPEDYECKLIYKYMVKWEYY